MKRHYFYTNYEGFIKSSQGFKTKQHEVIKVKNDNITNAEDKARAYAKQLGKSLAGGYTSYGEYIEHNEQYIILNCPNDIKPLERELDVVDLIMAMEGGGLSDEDTIKLFQKLINDGSVWSLQGSYGRMAKRLIKQGYCHNANKQHEDTYGNTVPKY